MSVIKPKCTLSDRELTKKTSAGRCDQATRPDKQENKLDRTGKKTNDGTSV